ncbi:WecB/TagA/CpsF family glycosyltransferase [Candidatus Daviesbacteria bacterium]|nr:WecB/TagA/CpsF family glycosyltransferase [Candidatus Daviesbacteria bacterium]
MKKTVLGVKIDDVSMDEALETVHGWLKKSFGYAQDKHYIVTPNPEFLITAQKDLEFKRILNEADLSIPDGVWLKLSGVKNTVPGVDLMEKLVEKSTDWAVTVGFLGGRNGVAEKAVKCLLQKYPEIKITFAISDPPTSFHLPPTDLLFVAFGHPKQEKWIAENLSYIPVKIAMGVGGAFDYISGKVPRAPKFLRDFGLEWLFRLIAQPWRIKRQLALLKYLFLVLK